MWGLVDKLLAKLKKTVTANFSELEMLSWNELTSSGVKDRTKAMYNRLMENNKACLLEIAKQTYDDIVDELIEMDFVLYRHQAPDGTWVENYLKSFNRVSQYLYYSEADRKRLRLAEEIQTAKEFKDKAMLKASVEKAKNLWWNQTSTYMVDIVDAVRLEMMGKSSNVDMVRWNAEHDERTCEECEKRDGTVYMLGSIPVKHRNCRCWLTPVKISKS